MKEQENVAIEVCGQREASGGMASEGIALQLFAQTTDDIEWTQIKDTGKPIFTSPEMEEADDASETEEDETDNEEGEEILEDSIYFPRLQATDQNLPHTTIGEVLVNDEEGSIFSVKVDKSGMVTESLKLIENENIADGAITGEKLAEGTITSRELDMSELFEGSAQLNQMLTANIDVGELFQNEEYTEALTEHIRSVSRIILADGANLNTVTEPGFYICTGTTLSNSITNKPSDVNNWSNGFALDVISMCWGNAGDSTAQQVMYSQADIWTRYWSASSNTWTAWGRSLTSLITSDIQMNSYSAKFTTATGRTMTLSPDSRGMIGLFSSDSPESFRSLRVWSPEATTIYQALQVHEHIGSTDSYYDVLHTGSIQMGEASYAPVNITAGAQVSYDVQFGREFGRVPRVIVSGNMPGSAAWVTPRKDGVTTKGFKIYFTNTSSSAINTSHGATWLAIIGI